MKNYHHLFTPIVNGVAGLIFIISGFFVANFGLQPEHQLVSMFMPILMAIPSFMVLKKLTSLQTFLGIIITLSVLAFSIESFGIITGFPYGNFHYSEALGLKLFAIVPANLPFAWIPLVLGAYTLSAHFTKKHKISSPFSLVVLGTLFLLIFDLIIDPAAVLFQLWAYQNPGIYFGVPWSNFVGWIISGFLGMLILNAFLKGKSSKLLGLSAGWMILFWTSAWTFKFFLQSPFSLELLHSFFTTFSFFPAIIGIVLSAQLLKIKA